MSAFTAPHASEDLVLRSTKPDRTRRPFRDGSGAELLSQHECRRLLATAEMGRMALSVHGLPTVVPVDFALTGDGIVVSTARDSWVHAATHDTVVAFEIDGLDPTGASRWSVVVVGVATEASDITPDERIGLRVALGVESDAPTERLVRISLGLVTGRRTTVPVRAGDSLPAA